MKSSCAVLKTWTVAFALVLVSAFPANAQDWPSFRGPALDGTGTGLAPDVRGLELVWKRPLGSGYSSISVAGGRGITLFSDGENDVVLAFDAASGDELWRFPLAPTYRGHDGSVDGPLSTPALADGTAYVLGPDGHLAALDLADGKPRWTHLLDGKTNSRAPEYGFSTAPLILGDLLIVQTGGEGASVTAFDRTTGAVRWSVEDDPVSYQSPALVEILGEKLLIAAGDHFLLGLDAPSGHVLFKHRHTPDGKSTGASGHPLALGDGGLLLRTGRSTTRFFELTRDNGAYDIRELWVSDKTMQRAHSAVVHHDGHLFGFDNQFLTCLDPATGERVWKSRPPGGRGLIVVDGQLAVLGAGGHLVLAAAGGDGYRETARLKVFERESWTPPSYADGLFFVRNLEEMAAVRVTDTPPADAARRGPRGVIAELVRRLETADDRRAMAADFIEADFIEEQGSPVIEDAPVGEKRLVHFLYHGAVQDVALSGSMTPEFNEEIPLQRLDGTDLFYTSLELDAATHHEYRFHVDFSETVADPRNPYAIGSIFGPSSELRLPDWPVPNVIDGLDKHVLRGETRRVTIASAALGKAMEVELYLSPSASERGRRLVVVQESEGIAEARIPAVLDRLHGNLFGGEPFVVAFVPFLKQEHGSEALDRHSRWISEVVQWLERDNTGPSGSPILYGAGSGAPIAAYAAFAEPGRFGRLALQSFFLQGLFGRLGAGAFSVSPEARDLLLARVRDGEKQDLEVVIERSSNVFRDPASGLDMEGDAERFLEVLAARGYAVESRRFTAAPGWGGWRARIGGVLGDGPLAPIGRASAGDPGPPLRRALYRR